MGPPTPVTHLDVRLQLGVRVRCDLLHGDNILLELRLLAAASGDVVGLEYQPEPT